MRLRRPFLLVAFGAALIAPQAGAVRVPSPQGGPPLQVFGGESFSSMDGGPGEYSIQLQIFSFTDTPKAVKFEGRYLDEFGFVADVSGKIAKSNRKFTFGGKGEVLVLGRPGVLGPPIGATVAVKYAGQMSTSEDVILGTYKATYKNLPSTFKDVGGWYLED